MTRRRSCPPQSPQRKEERLEPAVPEAILGEWRDGPMAASGGRASQSQEEGCKMGQISRTIKTNFGLILVFSWMRH